MGNFDQLLKSLINGRLNKLKDVAFLKRIKDILGHTDIRTTMKYTNADFEGQRVVFQGQQKKAEVIGLQNEQKLK